MIKIAIIASTVNGQPQKPPTPNATWPADHQLFNRGFGASNPHGVTTCLASHLAPHTDILTVDFNLMGWTAPEQERKKEQQL